MRTTDKEKVEEHRLFRGDDKQEVRLELWEHDHHDKSKWAVAFLTDYRTKQGGEWRVSVDDETAGWLQRHMVRRTD